MIRDYLKKLTNRGGGQQPLMQKAVGISHILLEEKKELF